MHNSSCIDFLPIPNHERYAISRNGQVVDTQRGKLLRLQSYPNGYKYYHLRHQDGSDHTHMQHRLLKEVFDPIPNMEQHVVDHVNGNKSDNTLSNLQWVTQKQNCERAGRLGLTPKCRPVEVLDIETGESRSFISATEAGAFYGVSKDTILLRIHIGSTILFPEGRRYRFASQKPWPEISVEDTNRYREIMSEPIHVLQIETNIQTSYESIRIAARAIGCSVLTILKALMRKDQAVIPNKMAIQFGSFQPWKPFDYWRELRETHMFPEVLEVETGILTQFSSISALARAWGTSPTTMLQRVRTRGRRIIDGYRFAYYPELTDSTLVRLNSDV